MLLYAINLASHILRLGIRIIVWVFGKGTQRLFCFISKLTRRNNRFGWDFTEIVCIVLFGTYLYYAVGYNIFKVFGWRSFVEVKLRLYKSIKLCFSNRTKKKKRFPFDVYVNSMCKFVYIIECFDFFSSFIYFALTCKIKINRFLN